MLTIDKDKPMPNGFGVRGKYPFAQLDVGHSFFVPGKTAGGFHQHSKCTSTNAWEKVCIDHRNREWRHRRPRVARPMRKAIATFPKEPTQ
jgi:hypothetical protein